MVIAKKRLSNSCGALPPRLVTPKRHTTGVRFPRF
jgi:hypothetical protein